LIRVSTSFVRAVSAIAAIAALTWCVAAASTTVPAITDGSKTLVAVEPLLQSLELSYVIEGTHLQIGDRDYPMPLVIRDGVWEADARDLARFLHLDLANRNGLLVFSSPDAPSADASPAPPPGPVLASVRTALLDALNEHRKAAGYGPLTDDSIADEAAQFQAQDMAERGMLRHDDRSGRTPMQRYNAFGGHAGQTRAKAQPGPAPLVDGLTAGPNPHRITCTGLRRTCADLLIRRSHILVRCNFRCNFRSYPP